MNKFAAIVTVGISLVSCSPSNSAPAQTLESKIADMAKVMSTVTPKQLEGGLSLDAVTAEGGTLVLKMSGIPKWRPNVTDAEAGKLMGAMICNPPRVQGLVKEGARFRIDGISPSGEKLPPLPICLDTAANPG